MSTGRLYLADKALELIKQLQRTTEKNIPPFNDDYISAIIEEIKHLFRENMKEVAESSEAGEVKFFPGIQIRHSCLEHNKRCILVYVYNRIMEMKKIRWQLTGSLLPAHMKSAFSDKEVEWYKNYCENLDQYVKAVGVDVTKNTVPSSSLFLKVHCTVNAGKVMMEDGSSINLRANTEHYLPIWQCEKLLKQGVVKYADTD